MNPKDKKALQVYFRSIFMYVIFFAVLGISIWLYFGIEFIPPLVFVFVFCGFIPLFKGKHSFYDSGKKPMPDIAPNWIGYVCEHCSEQSGLDARQLRHNIWDMSYCENGNSVSFFELLFGNFNCLKKSN